MTIAALAAIVLLQTVHLATNARATSNAFADVDLGPEVRVLDKLLADLSRFDKKNAELSKKASLTRAEFDSQQKTADDLKRQLPSVQTAFGDAIKKLKTAGLWDNLNQLVLEKTGSRLRPYVEQDNFKKILEDSGSTLSNNANEISSPVEQLRSKVQARGFVIEPGTTGLSSRAVRVAYSPSPVMFAKGLRCTLAGLRFGLSGFVHGAPSVNAGLGFECFCEGKASSCAATS